MPVLRQRYKEIPRTGIVRIINNNYYSFPEYAGKYPLKCHIKARHEGEVNCICELCGKGFQNIGQLTSHIKDHGGPHGGKRKKKPKQKCSAPPEEFDDNYFKQN